MSVLIPLLLLVAIVVAVGVSLARVRRLAAEAQVLRGRMTAELQDLARRLDAGHGDARAALARDLHDDLGQSLTAIKLSAGQLRDGDPARGVLVDDIVALADDGLRRVRELSRDLRSATPPRPPAPADLTDALRAHVDERMRRSGVPITTELAPLAHSPAPATATACLRIAQEAITNALRHANGSALHVLLAETPDGLLLQVSDRGPGMPARARAGLGLASMRERAEAVGGTLDIQPVAPHGTCIRATLPAAA